MARYTVGQCARFTAGRLSGNRARADGGGVSTCWGEDITCWGTVRAGGEGRGGADSAIASSDIFKHFYQNIRLVSHMSGFLH